jgi:pyrrolysine biosynthesis protein PylD
MTRLKGEDLVAIPTSFTLYQNKIQALLGTDLIGLAASALDLSPEQARSALSGRLVAVVPRTTGQGLIPGFSEALATIAAHMGLEAVITAPDLEGFREAKRIGASLMLSSDDDLFLARSLKEGDGSVSENGDATGRGYAQALWLLSSGSIAGQEALVAGCGYVGMAAAQRLSQLGVRPIIMDLDEGLARWVAGVVPGALPWEPSLVRVPQDYRFFLDATPSDRPWPQELMPPDSYLAAPGMPMAFRESPGLKIWHDPLETGTAVMLLEACLPPS